jgi:hypothetical protein
MAAMRGQGLSLACFWTAAAFGAAFLVLAAGLPVVAFAAAGHDDAMYVKLAGSIRSGQWLGAYNNLTLSKGSGYPLWLALVSSTKTPLLLAQAGLYLAAGSCLLAAAARLTPARWLLVAAFALYLFNPVTFHMTNLRVIREGLYVPLTVLIAALMLWQFALRGETLRIRLPWALALGVALAWFWITREEGVWIVFGLATAWLGVTVINLTGAARKLHALGREAVVGLAVITVLVGGVQAVMAVNKGQYGVREIVEFKQRGFLDAYGALARIEHRQWRPYVVVPRDALARAFEASPAFRETQPYFDGLGAAWAQHGCNAYQVNPCDGEIRSGWFMWALRDAVAVAGYYSSARAARDYYVRLAREINDACADGRLACSAPRRTMLPPFRSGYLRDAARTFLDGIAFIVAFRNVDTTPAYSAGDADGLDRFRSTTNSAIFPGGPQLVIRGRATAAAFLHVAIDTPSGREARTDSEQSRSTAAGTGFKLRTDCTVAGCALVVGAADRNLARIPVGELRPGPTAQPDDSTLDIESVQRLGPEAVPSARYLQNALAAVNGLLAAYRAVMPAIVIAASAFFVLSLAVGVARRELSALVAINAALLAMIGARLALLSYLHVTSMPGIEVPYLAPVYPLMFWFCAFALIDGVPLVAAAIPWLRAKIGGNR